MRVCFFAWYAKVNIYYLFRPAIQALCQVDKCLKSISINALACILLYIRIQLKVLIQRLYHLGYVEKNNKRKKNIWTNCRFNLCYVHYDTKELKTLNFANKKFQNARNFYISSWHKRPIRKMFSNFVTINELFFVVLKSIYYCDGYNP